MRRGGKKNHLVMQKQAKSPKCHYARVIEIKSLYVWQSWTWKLLHQMWLFLTFLYYSV